MRPSAETNILFPVDAYETARERGTAAVARAIAAAICAFTPGESTVLPAGSWKTGTIELTAGSMPYFLNSARFVSKPSRPGTENSCESAFVARWRFGTPPIRTSIHSATTIRLWRRTNRANPSIARA